MALYMSMIKICMNLNYVKLFIHKLKGQQLYRTKVMLNFFYVKNLDSNPPSFTYCVTYIGFTTRNFVFSNDSKSLLMP